MALRTDIPQPPDSPCLMARAKHTRNPQAYDNFRPGFVLDTGVKRAYQTSDTSAPGEGLHAKLVALASKRKTSIFTHLANTRLFVWIGRSVNRGYNNIGLILGGIQSTGSNIVADRALMLLNSSCSSMRSPNIGFADVPPSRVNGVIHY